MKNATKQPVFKSFPGGAYDGGRDITGWTYAKNSEGNVVPITDINEVVTGSVYLAVSHQFETINLVIVTARRPQWGSNDPKAVHIDYLYASTDGTPLTQELMSKWDTSFPLHSMEVWYLAERLPIEGQI